MSDVVFKLVLYAWGGLAASFGPAVIFSLWWKRTTKWGVVAGMITGAFTIMVWHNSPYLSNIIYELFPGFFFSMFAIILVSLITKPPADINEEFEKALDVKIRKKSAPETMKSQMMIVTDFLKNCGLPG